MTDRDRNWLNLFGKYTPTETAWHGWWTSYDVTGVATKTRQVVRSFRSNADNSAIAHTNRYINEDTDEQSWQLIKAMCNQADGVVHPATSAMRAIAFDKGASAWLRPTIAPGEKFGGELFFIDRNWRTSVVLVYAENGTFSRLVHIREHLGSFSDNLDFELPVVDGLWFGEKYSMLPDLQLLPTEHIQKSLNLFESDAPPTSGSRPRTLSLPQGTIVTIPETVQIGYTASEANWNNGFQLAASQFTTDGRLKSLAINYDASGTFTSLSCEVLQAVGAVIG